MSTTRLDKSSLPDPSYHWTTRKAAAFLGALAEFGRISEAARAVGMSRQSAYCLRAKLGEASVFARAWDDALERGRVNRQTRRLRSRKLTTPALENDIFGIGR
jgi:molybdenum-dependent DNA-binding transcriptional regulator ModE